MKKIKPYDLLRSTYTEKLDKALTLEFGKFNFKTQWNILGYGFTTSWEKKLKPKEKEKIEFYINAWNNAYTCAMNQLP
jgi:hypothetical protein